MDTGSAGHAGVVVVDNGSQPQKFSRYRSVKNATKTAAAAAAAASAASPPPPAEEAGFGLSTVAAQNPSIARSMSRYHRRARAPSAHNASSAPPPPPPPPSVPQVPRSPPTAMPPIASPRAVAVSSEGPMTQTMTSPRPDNGSPRMRDGSLPKANPPQASPGKSNPSTSRPATNHGPPRHDGGAVAVAVTVPHWESGHTQAVRRSRDRAPTYDRARQEAREILFNEEERLAKLKAQQDAVKAAERRKRRRKEEEEARHREEQENAVRERERAERAEWEAVEAVKRGKLLEAERRANKKEAARVAVLEAKKAAKAERKERFAFLSRDNGEDSAGFNWKKKDCDTMKKIISSPKPVDTPEFGPWSPNFNRIESAVESSPKTSQVPLVDEPPKTVTSPIGPEVPKFIEPGGGGIVPGTDAPISAVNVDGRKVAVRCNDSFITLPITPSTTASDLIFSAANCLSENIDPKRSVLLESFTQLGLERPLRKYEHIRDVMNSWDNDGQNTLLIMPTPEGEDDDDLDVKNAPREQPGDTSVLIYHSMRPGHWDKRWATLRSDGQVLISKKADGDKTNICHISDFDIYTPTARQFKKMKPPKKLCYAVKSQQKSSMFLSGANFVHFFSSNDKKVASAWYKAILGWRSWYLVNVLGEGQKKSTKSNGPPQLDSLAFASSSQIASQSQPGGHQRSLSADSTPYLLGSFAPLFEADELKQTASFAPQRSTSISRLNQNRALPAREAKYPPSSFPNKLTKEISHGRGASLVQGASPREAEDTTFAPDSLLGRTYSQRQKVQREREMESHNGPFLPGLITQAQEATPSSRNNSIQSVNDAPVGLTRSSSNRQKKPKPLIDLTPVYQTPPQHTRKGRGVAVEAGTQLIDAATGPDLEPGVIAIPPATTWRKPQAQAGGSGAPDGGIHRTGPRRATTSGQRSSIDAGTRPSGDENSPFTGTGLLATRSRDMRPTGTGRGVATGDRQARTPMLDMNDSSQFQEGSLLRSVEMHTGSGGPIIDREKRVEGNVKVGENV